MSTGAGKGRKANARASWLSSPITALYKIPDTHLICAGQSGRVSLYSTQGEANDASVSLALPDAASDSVHGFAGLTHSKNEHRIIVWGASIIRTLLVRRDHEDDRWCIRAASPPVDTKDWILDICAIKIQVNRSEPELLVLINAHNEVRFLSCQIFEHDVSLYILPQSPIDRRLVMLYCGHVISIDGRILVAAGTMFGQVLFEAYDIDTIGSSSGVCLHLITRDVFHDHEGSIFGVRILEHPIMTKGQPHYRLASCSDDRTVRTYEIREGLVTNSEVQDHASRTGFVDFLHLPTLTPIANRGRAMGHESRIWSVLWLESDQSHSKLMTFGEDTTAQTWTVKHAQFLDDHLQDQASMTSVVNFAIFGFHIGKNIWAACAWSNSGKTAHICTGGADGRIVTFKVELLHQDPPVGQNSMSLNISPSQISRLVRTPWDATPKLRNEETEYLFNSLKGRWTLQRTISSKRTDYPSGTFEGEATFAARPVGDEPYNIEMLYKENGALKLATGMAFQARRNYVYRFSRASQTISAWFVKPDAPSVVDYLFHEVKFDDKRWETTTSVDSLALLEATGYHLCAADHYNAVYRFEPSEDQLKRWTLSYHVTGPKKDYVATTSFARIEEAAQTAADILPKIQSRITNSRASKPDSFRSYTWVNERECLITTDQGRLITARALGVTELSSNTMNPELTLRAQKPSLSSYSITCPLSSTGVLIAAASGDLFHYSASAQEVEYVASFPSKIVSLIPVDTGDRHTVVLIKCLRESSIQLVPIATESRTSPSGKIKNKIRSSSEVPRGFFAISAGLFDKDSLLAVGSRADGLSIWRADWSQDQALAPVAKFQRVLLHAENAITSITTLSRPTQVDHAYTFATTGRDGMLKVHRLTADLDSMETIHALKWSYGSNLEGAAFNPRVTLWGFDGTDFVVADYTRNMELMRVPCGNSHRNWAFRHASSSTNDFSASLVWTQANSCHIRSVKAPSNSIIVNGGHGREIKAIAKGEIDGIQLVATGAEDTDIKLFSTSQAAGMDISDRSLEYRATLSRHEAGLTALAFTESYVFSAGGKEELFMWKIQSLPKPLKIAICFQAECPKVEDGLLRITDFCLMDPGDVQSNDTSNQTKDIAVVYSDSTLRIWKCNFETPAFELVAFGKYGQNCLTCVQQLQNLEKTVSRTLITGSTDGYLVIWNVYMFATAEHDSSCNVVKRFKTHDSAIKALQVHSLGFGRSIIVTGGDDGSVAITLLRETESISQGWTAQQTRIPRAHAAAVNAVSIVQESRSKPKDDTVRLRVASTGSDQRVVEWELSVDRMWSTETESNLSVKRKSHRTAVADASGLICLGESLLVVAGVGVEMIRIES